MPAVPDSLLRTALGITAVANLLVAALVMAPQSLPGQFAGLPQEPVPAAYRALLTLFIALFGATYAWIAGRAVIDRSLLMLGAIGKLLAFVAVLGLWLAGLASAKFALLMAGDLAFAAVFLAWLFGDAGRGP